MFGEEFVAKLRNFQKGPEAIIQEKIIIKLKSLDWSVRHVSGNMYTFGFPDLYCCHRIYGARWVEVKDPKRKGNIFTPAQHEYFHELATKRVGVWILTSDSDSEIAKLHGSPNWYQYLAIFNK